MAKQDPSWMPFRKALRSYMNDRGVSAEALARAVGVSRDDVANWKRETGGSTPLLSLLPQISKELGMGGPRAGSDDPHWLLQQMGLLRPHPSSQEAHQLALQLQDLQHRLLEAQDTMSASAGRGGASIVLKAALDSGDWAVAAWPAIEGPAACRMYVMDRLDVRRVDGGTLDVRTVWNDKSMRDALRSTYAYPSHSGPRWENREPKHVSQWAIPHLEAPRPVDRRVPFPQVPTIAFTALTVESWVHQTASLVSMALGYGFTTTRSLALDTSTVSPGDSPRSAGRSEPSQRRQAHKALLQRPPEGRVWSHSSLSTQELREPFGDGAEPVFHVWMCETDELLDSYLELWNHNSKLATLQQDRERIRQMASTRDDVLVVDVSKAQNREARWSQALEAARTVLVHLTASGLIGAQSHESGLLQERQMHRDPKIAGPYFNWLHANGWPIAALG